MRKKVKGKRKKENATDPLSSNLMYVPEGSDLSNGDRSPFII